MYEGPALTVVAKVIEWTIIDYYITNINVDSETFFEIFLNLFSNFDIHRPLMFTFAICLLFGPIYLTSVVSAIFYV